MSVAIVVVVAGLGLGLMTLSIRCAADRRTVTAPSGRAYEVLVNREGVTVYSHRAAWGNAYASLPAVTGALRRRRRGLTGWLVHVRPSPSAGYSDLYCEPADAQLLALERQHQIADVIEAGETLWPPEAEWYR